MTIYGIQLLSQQIHNKTNYRKYSEKDKRIYEKLLQTADVNLTGDINKKKNFRDYKKNIILKMQLLFVLICKISKKLIFIINL